MTLVERVRDDAQSSLITGNQPPNGTGETEGYRRRSRTAAGIATPGSTLSRRLRDIKEASSNRGYRFPRTEDRSIRRWMLLAWLPGTRHLAEKERGVLAAEDRSQPRQRRGYECEAPRSWLDGTSVLAARVSDRSGEDRFPLCDRGQIGSRSVKLHLDYRATGLHGPHA